MLLVRLAEEAGLRERTQAMFRGEHINVTEDRAVLHVALRMPRERSLIVDGRDVVAEVHEVLDRMAAFSERIRSGEWRGHTGQADPQRRQHRDRRLRPRPGDGPPGAAPLLATATSTIRFVSNVDATDFVEKTRDLDPAETLFVVASKTFTTLETMTNARSAREWSLTALGGRGRGRQALRRALDQRRRGLRLRHRHRQHVRLLGLGRRPLLDGLGDRADDDDRDRPGAVRGDARRLPRDRRALPRGAVRGEPAGADGAAERLVRGPLRLRDGRRLPLRPVPGALPRLPPAADDGVQRQARPPRRRAASTTRPARSSGASPGPTASTPSTS